MSITSLKWDVGPASAVGPATFQRSITNMDDAFVYDVHVYNYPDGVPPNTEVSVELDAPTAELGRELAELLVETARTFAKAKGY